MSKGERKGKLKYRLRLEKLPRKKEGKVYTYWWIVRGRWDRDKKRYVERKPVMRVSEGTLEETGIERFRKWLKIASDEGKSHLWAIDRAIEEVRKERSSAKGISTLKDISCYGSLYVFYKVALHLYGHHRFKDKSWHHVLVMIASRLRFSGSSKLRISRLWEGERALWDVLGIKDKPEVDKLYEALDWLNSRWGRIVGGHINKYVVARERRLLLFDVTSLWTEGNEIGIARFGYSREGKQGKKQIIVGVISGVQGQGIDAEVFVGNMADVEVIRKWIKRQVNRYGIKGVVLIGDGAMLPPVEQSQLSREGIKFIGMLPLPQAKKLLREKNINLDLWDRKIQEVELGNGERLVLTYSPIRRQREWNTLRRRLRRLHEALRQVRNKVRSGRLYKAEAIWKEVGQAIGRRPNKTMFIVEVGDGYMDYRLNRDRLSGKVRYMGVWALKTNVEDRSGEEIRDDYKLLYYVERSFRYLKMVLLHTRPIYHRLPERIRAHVRLSLMTLNVFLLMNDHWKDILDKYNAKKGRKYKISRLEALQLLDKVKIVALEGDEQRNNHFIFIPPKETLVRELLSALPVKMA